ncbi:T9SS type A sorting domain-containing protein, partial [Marinilabilia sp.]
MEAKVIYVNNYATETSDGTSWSNGYKTYGDAYAEAASGDTIVFAAGLYQVSTGSRHGTYRLKDGVKVFGGFAGTEEINEQSIAARNFYSNQTIISGDVNGDDFTTENITDNVYHVVTAEATISDITDATRFDGFTIIGGNANGYGAGGTPTSGGGLMLEAGGGFMDSYTCSPIFANLKVIGNKALSHGGGAFLYSTGGNCSPRFERCEFSSNYAGSSGGGVHMSTSTGTCAPEFKDVTFSYNEIGSGAPSQGSAIYGTSEFIYGKPAQLNPVFDGLTVFNNLGNTDGALVISTGNSYVSSSEGIANITIQNSTFVGNGSRAIRLYKYGTDSEFSANITNTIVWGDNTLYAYQFTPVITNCLIQNSGGSGAGWDTTLGTDNGGNIDTNPLMANSEEGDVRLLTGSPALNAGLTAVGANIGSYQESGISSAALISISGFKWMFGDLALGTTSSEYSYDVSGSNLTDDIVIVAPEGFQLTTTAGDYSGNVSQLTLSPTSGIVETTSIFVRFAPTEEKSYYGNINHTSTDALTQQFTVTGEGIIPPPKLFFPVDVEFEEVEVNSQSHAVSVEVNGSNLTDDVVVSVSGPFVINTDIWQLDQGLQEVTLSQSDGEVSRYVYFQFRPTSHGLFEESIQISSTGAETVTRIISGTGTVPTAIEDPAFNSIQIYPNPAKEWIKVDTDLNVEEITLLNIAGIVVRKVNKGNKMSIADLPKGIYIVFVNLEEQQIRERIILK